MPRKKKVDTPSPITGEVFIVKDITPLPSNLSVPKRPAITFSDKKPFIRRLLEDDISLAQIRELASTGSSITTIEAILKYPPGRLRTVLEKGRQQVDSKGPYKKFYMMFRSWVAEARSKAEATMASRTPEKWMDRNSSNRLLESEEDRSLAIESSNNNKPVGPNLTVANMLRAMEILREQGISIDESIDKGQFHITTNTEDTDDDD